MQKSLLFICSIQGSSKNDFFIEKHVPLRSGWRDLLRGMFLDNFVVGCGGR